MTWRSPGPTSRPRRAGGDAPGSRRTRHAFRLARLAEVGVTLPPDLERAVAFVEGEGAHYSNRERVMSPLAAFCHMCDVASARLWYDYPRERDDPWARDGRAVKEGL